jgi:hypothetical protein
MLKYEDADIELSAQQWKRKTPIKRRDMSSQSITYTFAFTESAVLFVRNSVGFLV